jgi:drug/metabolite transporter (DMT)-like permease
LRRDSGPDHPGGRRAFFLLAARRPPLSVAAPVTALAPVATLVPAVIIDGERICARRLVGLGLAATALVRTGT